uniref:Saposin-like,IPR008139 Saposin B,domain-containing protein n=2 Tax=Schistosoma japonicum TaxID=6182 RepID=C1L8M2_SCHJA|nr:Saposin-like,IPR008139 Saposin B,domain-containing protein [Schistosoma japonicum]CAX71054.1 Saposin-like,IPR008139 Saposin B,domain-containing protein [Schistosoma japonicum]
MLGIIVLLTVFMTGFATSANHTELDIDYKHAACNIIEYVQEKSLQIMKEEQFIKNLIEYVLLMTCENVNDLSIKRRCIHIMASETEMILKDFIDFVEINKLRTMLTWCQPSLKTANESNSTFVCSTCETLVTFMKTFTQSEEAKSFIHQVIDKVCSLTGAFQSQCSLVGDIFVDKYLDMITQMSSSSACQTIQLCPL